MAVNYISAYLSLSCGGKLFIAGNKLFAEISKIFVGIAIGLERKLVDRLYSNGKI